MKRLWNTVSAEMKALIPVIVAHLLCITAGAAAESASMEITTLPSDVDALLTLFTAMNGRLWIRRWSVAYTGNSVPIAASDPCAVNASWFGVTCEPRSINGTQYHVVT